MHLRELRAQVVGEPVNHPCTPAFGALAIEDCSSDTPVQVEQLGVDHAMCAPSRGPRPSAWQAARRSLPAAPLLRSGLRLRLLGRWTAEALTYVAFGDPRGLRQPAHRNASFAGLVRGFDLDHCQASSQLSRHRYSLVMNGRKAKAARRARQARTACIANADYARRSAEAVLAVDLGDVPLNRVTQISVGWLRAAFEQSRVIACLTVAGMSSSAAPARRLYAELCIRTHWLHSLPKEDRAGAVDAMLDHERNNTVRTFDHLREMGWDGDVDLTEMNEFVLNVTDNGRVRNQAQKFAAAAHATDVKNTGLFRAWREESSYAHASGYLAGAFAPMVNNRLGTGAPPVLDPDLEAHRMVQLFIVIVAYRLLVDEGTSESAATRALDAFLAVR